MIKQGQTYRANTNIEITCMTSWRAPYTGGHKRSLPAGEEFIITNDPPEQATAVYADPLNYDKLHKQFVPWTDRIRFLLYTGYYLCIELETIRTGCSLVEDIADEA